MCRWFDWGEKTVDLVEIRQHEIVRLKALAKLVGGSRGAAILARSSALERSWTQFDQASDSHRHRPAAPLLVMNYARWGRLIP